MNILAVDCGCFTGWATLIQDSIRSGVEKMKHHTNESPGMKYLRFDAWIEEIDKIGKFDLIVYEKPHGLQGNAVESMNGYITGIHRYIAKNKQWVQRNKIEYQAVSPATIKKWATGNGRASKDDMKRWFFVKEGHYPISDDQSDAMALLFFIMTELNIKEVVK